MSLAPLIVSTSDNAGGGDRAAWRLHRSLVQAGLDSRMLVAHKTIGDWRVEGPGSLAGKAWSRFRPFLGRAIMALQRTDNPYLHSSQLLPSSLSTRLNASEADVINLHWVCGEMMSIRDIGRLTKPVVMTLHDTWAFCGTEHYPGGSGKSRFVDGFTRHTRPVQHGGLDIDRIAFQLKLRKWRRPLLVVTPSQWLANCVSASALMREWPVQVIPNPLPLNVYQPWPRPLARQAYGIDPQARVILFGAIGGASSVKGWDLLEPALRTIAESSQGVQAVVVGQAQPREPARLGMPIRYVPRLTDDVSMAVLLSCADVVVVPSRLENLPQMATEAQACGVPVVGFRTGGVPETLLEGATGILANPFDPIDLARAILEVIGSQERRGEMALRARQHAVQRWSYEAVSRQYRAAYEHAIAQHRNQYGR